MIPNEIACPIPRGARVRLKKGCKILYTTHPSHKPTEVKRSTVVTVATAFSGWNGIPGYPQREPEISWAGTGGYWFHTNDFENIEVLTTP